MTIEPTGYPIFSGRRRRPFSGRAGAFAGRAVQAFSPLSLGPAAWYDASDTSSIVSSGGAVSQWNDKSGNGYHATQATGANQPITGTRTINGRNVLDFDGSNDHLILPAGLYDLPSGANAAVLFYQLDVTGSQYLLRGNIAGSGRYGVREGEFGNTRLAFIHRSGDDSQMNCADTTNTNIHAVVFTRSGATLTAYKNGTNISLAYTAQSVTVDSLYFGTTGAGSMNARFAEAIFFRRVPTAAELNQLCGVYGAAKWGNSWTNI